MTQSMELFQSKDRSIQIIGHYSLTIGSLWPVSLIVSIRSLLLFLLHTFPYIYKYKSINSAK